VVQHRAEHVVVRHAFWQVMHARYSHSPIEGSETRRAPTARRPRSVPKRL
jgi:hypothetical protein